MVGGWGATGSLFAVGGFDGRQPDTMEFFDSSGSMGASA